MVRQLLAITHVPYVILCEFFILYKNKSDCVFAGAKIFQNVTVDSVLTKNRSVCGVETNNGGIECEVFVNCGGMVSDPTT